MASRSNALLSMLANVVRQHPRVSAGLAFELGVMVGSYIKTARGRGGLAEATAKLIDAVPLIPHASPARKTHETQDRSPQARQPCGLS